VAGLVLLPLLIGGFMAAVLVFKARRLGPAGRDRRLGLLG
jgi:hypothetical protein